MNIHSKVPQAALRRKNATPRSDDSARLSVRVSGEKNIGTFHIQVPLPLVMKMGNPDRVSILGTVHEGLSIRPDMNGQHQCREYSATHRSIVMGLKAAKISKEPRRMVEVRCEYKGGRIVISGPPEEWVQARDFWKPKYQEPSEFRVSARGPIIPVMKGNVLPADPITDEKDPDAPPKPIPDMNGAGPSPTAPLPKQPPIEVTPEIPCPDGDASAMMADFNTKIEELRQLKAKIDTLLITRVALRTVLKRDLSGLTLIPAAPKPGGSP